MKFISNEQLKEALRFYKLIPALQSAFCENITVPLRHHHQFDNPKENTASTLLLMPAWKSSDYLGVKIVTVAPNNVKYNLPSIHGLYLLFDAHKGLPIAQMDAKLLTSLRTAAASALASFYLSKKNSHSLLMVGTGSLAPWLIKAHAFIRPIDTVYVWGRNFEKAKALVANLDLPHIDIQAVKNIASKIAKADIISCATLSNQSLIEGKWLQPGQHLDLVGSFKPDMREVDDTTIQRSNIYVDTLEGATKESGDILLPLKSGVLSLEDIQADLFDMCQNDIFCRKDNSDITLFKSVGHALEDLAAARLVFESI